MSKFLEGIKLGLGFIFVIGLLFSLVYAVGFHTANEILGGTFNGTFIFAPGSTVNLTGVNVNGLSSESGVLKDSNTLCNSTNDGVLRYNTTSKVLDICNGDIWREIKNIGTKKSCKEILDIDNPGINGIYEIDPDGPGGNMPFDVYCDITGGGWTLVVGIQAGNNFHVNSAEINSANLISPSGIGKYDDSIINGIQTGGSNQLKMICNGVSQIYNSCNFDADTVTNGKAGCLGTSASGGPSYRVGLGSNNGQYAYNNAISSIESGAPNQYTDSKGCSTPAGSVVGTGYSGTVWVR